MDLESFRSTATQLHESVPLHQTGKRQFPRHYIRGPIDLDWLEPVLQLPGRAPLALALAIQYQAGLTKSQTVRVTSSLLLQFRLPKRTAYDAIFKLSSIGLIRVESGQGKCREVTILKYASPSMDPPSA